MVKTKAELKAIAAAYVKNLRAHHIEIEKVLLFGSYARGTAQENSDIDLAFISKDFDRYNLLERQKILADCREGLVRTDVLGYSPTAIQKKRDYSAILRQVLSEGIPIYPA